MEKKKVGIISYWDTQSNYGQILQGVALQYILKFLGYNPVTIRYILPTEKPNKVSILHKIKKLIKDDISIFERIKSRLNQLQNKKCQPIYNSNLSVRKFNEFKQKYLKLSIDEYHSIEQFKTIVPQFYAFITGSDQVWHEAGGYERKQIFLLDFLSTPVKRLSYAASFGRDKIIDKNEIKLFRECLAKFDGVSVREQSGLTLCKYLQCNKAVKVPDPTLLLTKEEWLSYLNINIEQKKSEKKVFFYSLKANDPRIHDLINFFQEKEYTILYVCSDTILDKSANIEPTIEEWLKLIATADFVVTNSFHGTIFSLNFNVPVISIGNRRALHKGQNQRMYSIMKELGLLKFFINEINTDEITQLLSIPINWCEVNNYINNEKKTGLFYLQNHLKNETNN